MVGNCDTGSSCAYTNSLSWKNPDTPLAGGSESAIGVRAAVRHGRSEPSRRSPRAPRSVSKEHSRPYPRGRAAPDDRSGRGGPAQDGSNISPAFAKWKCASPPRRRIRSRRRPRSRPAFRSSTADYVKLMFDLQVIAFQADLTRVSTMMLGREGSVRTYPEIGVPDPHHPLTHHRGHPDFIEKVTKINCLPRRAVRRVSSSELKATPGWRRHAARSFRDPVRRRAERRQRAFEFRPAAAASPAMRAACAAAATSLPKRERRSRICSCSS